MVQEGQAAKRVQRQRCSLIAWCPEDRHLHSMGEHGVGVNKCRANRKTERNQLKERKGAALRRAQTEDSELPEPRTLKTPCPWRCCQSGSLILGEARSPLPVTQQLCRAELALHMPTTVHFCLRANLSSTSFKILFSPHFTCIFIPSRIRKTGCS